MPALRKVMDDYLELQGNRVHVWEDPKAYMEYIRRLDILEKRVDALYSEKCSQRELEGSNSSTNHESV